MSRINLLSWLSILVLSGIWSKESTGAIRVNELMIRPVSNGEWIELAVMRDLDSGAVISIIDVSEHHGTISLDQPLIAGDYFIVTSDSITASELNNIGTFHCIVMDHWPSLNNDGDSLRLFVENVFVESIHYSTDLVPPAGRSLERIDLNKSGDIETNWGECADISGSSAGRSNSLHTVQTSASIRLWADPNPFNPTEGNGVTYFHFEIPSETARASLDIFTADGRPVIRLASDIPVGANAPSIPWNGTGGKGNCQTGRYVAVLMTFDRTGNSFIGKCTVVLVR